MSKETLELAREAGWPIEAGEELPNTGSMSLERLVELVRADEREACAKFCETHQVWVGQGKRGLSEWGEDDFVTGGIHQGMDYAAAIRARSEK
tara:strand:- start:114 stop:392 length:279 start_codon:yes stop_codon:yes gene_type:complete